MGLTLDEVKALCKPGKCPTDTNLRKIEEHIIIEHRTQWMAGKRVGFSTFVVKFLKTLEIDVEVNFDLTPNFLINKKNAVFVIEDEHGNGQYYDNRNSSHRELYFTNADDGKTYSINVMEQYHRLINGAEVNRDTARTRIEWQRVEGIRWKLPELYVCGSCGVKQEKNKLVYNEIQGDYLDIVCNHKMNNYENPRPKIDSPVGAYHSHKSTWKFIPQSKGRERSIPMGLELEMHSKISNSTLGATGAAQAILIDTIKDKVNYYFENDGSLAPGGFEMITNPMTLEYGSEWWTKMLPIIRKVCVGYSVEKHLNDLTTETDALNYGIHITVARKGLPDSVMAKISKFFDSKENQDFMCCIAQRHRMYGGYTLGAKNKPKVAGVLQYNKQYPGRMEGVQRSQPINIKGKLVEFRMFRSTLNTVSFIKNLEFLDAIITYYKEELGVSTHHRNFLLWLSKNTKRYPNLIQYLQHPVFFVKGVGKIKNSWLPLLKEVKVRIHDPYKEYGPLPVYQDMEDRVETSMVEG